MSYAVPLESFIKTLNRVSDYYDVDTKDHSKRAKQLATAIGMRYGMHDEELLFLGYGADIHDLGKVAIDRYILRQAAKLTRAQRVQVNMHCQYGYEIVEFGKVPKIISECILYHHEHYDGTGYPLGLSGDVIPIHSRITAIADVWDAITSARPYRAALDFDKALYFMSKKSTWFDPRVFSIFLELMREARHVTNPSDPTDP